MVQGLRKVTPKNSWQGLRVWEREDVKREAAIFGSTEDWTGQPEDTHLSRLQKFVRSPESKALPKKNWAHRWKLLGNEHEENSPEILVSVPPWQELRQREKALGSVWRNH